MYVIIVYYNNYVEEVHGPYHTKDDAIAQTKVLRLTAKPYPTYHVHELTP